MNISKIWVLNSVTIALLSLYASLSGIINSETYSKETANWALQAVGQDIGNLLAVPILLLCTYWITKNSPKAYLIWLGTLIYFIYAYMVYGFFIHFNFLFLVYVSILGLASYTLIGGLLELYSLNQVKLLAVKRVKPASILLILIGILFGFLWLSEVISALLSGQEPKSIVVAGLWVNPIQVIDLALVLPGMILTGILLWQKKLIGYLFAAPWLSFSALMGIGIVANMVLELNKGNSEAIVPLIMVGLIVSASLIVLYLYLKEIRVK
jgi:hypothetical protein